VLPVPMLAICCRTAAAEEGGVLPIAKTASRGKNYYHSALKRSRV
jgi:hypothetical protein